MLSVTSSNWLYGYDVNEVNKDIDSFKNDKAKAKIETSESFFYKLTSQGILDWLFNMCLIPLLWSVNSLCALRDEDVFNDLNNINVPTLILHGVHDTICPYPFAEYMNRTIKNSVLTPLTDGGHGAFYECKDEINKVLESFIYNYL